MHVNRKSMYLGVFLVAVGGVLLAADADRLDAAALTDALRLWPLAVVAIGLGIVLRQSWLGLGVGVLAVAIPGLMLGSALALVPRFAGDCGARGVPEPVLTEEGSFEGPASVFVATGCGAIAVNTAAGDDWRLAARNTEGQAPGVQASGQSLSVRSNTHGWRLFEAGRDDWDLTLPTSPMELLSVTANASVGRVALPGAQIERLRLVANASEITVDASATALDDLSGTVNAGSMAIQLPIADELVGSLRVNGGDLRICAPPSVALRVTTRGFLERMLVDGDEQADSEWQTPNYPSAGNRIELAVSANLGTVEVNPNGGCS
jgi:hypothetical protein